jgi:hypothetical protein
MNRHSHPTAPTRAMRRRARRVALLGAALALLPAARSADALVQVPSVPPGLEAPAGHAPYLMGRALGTQNYVCARAETSPTGVAWTLFGPQATVFDMRNRQIMTHFLSQNPVETGVPRATWHHSHDSSTVWAVRVEGSSDPAWVEPDAVPWLLLKVVGTQRGPRGGRRLAGTTYIQRIDTAGGPAPQDGCTSEADLAKTVLVPYSAHYVFYRESTRK